jgi:predicted nucleotide-binding protein
MPLHVRVRKAERNGSFKLGYAFNQAEEWVEERVLDPWQRGDELVLSGVHFQPKEVQLSIKETDLEIPEGSATDNARWREIESLGAVDRTNEMLDRPAGGSVSQGTPMTFAEDRRKVMVVVGRDRRVVDSLFTFLRTIDLQPQEWSALVGSVNSGAPYIGEVLDQAFNASQAVVALITPDDIAFLRPDLAGGQDPEKAGVPQGQARPNVFYEAGMAIAKFPTRTVFVEVGKTRTASDLNGIHAVRMDEGPECRRDLAQRLRNAGCEVNDSGTDWLRAGDFSEPSVDAHMPSDQENEKASLIRRIDAFIAELDSTGRASIVKGMLYNELVSESGLPGIPLSEPVGFGSDVYDMTEDEMRMLLIQVKLKV